MEDQEDYEEVTDEDEIIETTKPNRKVVRPIQRKVEKKQEVEEEKAPEARYVAYRVKQQEGIMDTETNTPVGNEVYVILAEILNKLNNIEISQA